MTRYRAAHRPRLFEKPGLCFEAYENGRLRDWHKAEMVRGWQTQKVNRNILISTRVQRDHLENAGEIEKTGKD